MDQSYCSSSSLFQLSMQLIVSDLYKENMNENLYQKVVYIIKCYKVYKINHKSSYYYKQIISFNKANMVLFVLYESPVGYALFELKQFDQVNTSVNSVLTQIANFETFSQIAHLKEFFPFESSAVALDVINNTNAGKAPEVLVNFLSEKFPMKKKSKVKLGVSDNKIAGAINDALEIQTTTSAVITQLLRGFRTHFLQFLKSEEIQNIDLDQSKLGLAHLFSRNKIALDVNRNDKPIIQSISLIELLDKDINTFSMRVKEWYSWHYPELAKIVTDNNTFVRLAHLIGNRQSSQATVQQIEEICGDADIAQKVLESCKNSMGQQISQFDIQCLRQLCQKTLKMFEFRTQIQQYLKNRMEIVSPNLTELIGQTVAAKLIAHSGSLSTLAKYPASTIQILGAQKALFRALKQKSKTPKYGLLYNTSFIGRAIGKNKGKISRYLANKCAMAARLDHFLVNPTNRFGQKLKEQVQKRLQKADDNEDLEKNEQLMDDILTELREQNIYFDSQVQLKKSLKKKKKAKKVVVQQEEQPAPQEPKKKKKIAKA